MSRVSRVSLYTLALSLVAGCASTPPGADCPRCPEPGADAVCPPAPPEPRAARAPIDADPLAPDRQRTIRLMGFTEDGSLLGLDVGDDLMGASFQVYDPKKRQVVKTYVYTPLTDKTTWAKVKRAHKLIDLETGSQRQPGSDLILTGAESDRWVIIYIMRGERAVPYYRIPRLDDEDGKPADVTIGRLAWTPDGRHAIVVHTQAIKRPRPFATDFIHVFELDPRRLPFD